jgi:magnesium transporter
LTSAPTSPHHAAVIKTWFLDDPRAPAVNGLADPVERKRPHWLEVVEPSEEEQLQLQQQYGLHEVTLRAALRKGHPPRLFEGSAHLGVIVQTPLAPMGDGFRKVALLLNREHIITLLRKPLAPLQHMMQKMRLRNPSGHSTPAEMLHGLLDQSTLGFEGLAEAIFDRSVVLERTLDDGGNGAFLKDLLTVRQDLLRLLRSLRRQRDVVQALARHDHDAIEATFRPFFRDVSDHVTRVHELAESARESLLALRDTHLSLVNNRLSETMRVLTVIATIMMPLSLIAGVYGMNVPGLPGMDSPLTFWLILGAMGLLAVLMLTWFRRRNWV